MPKRIKYSNGGSVKGSKTFSNIGSFEIGASGSQAGINYQAGFASLDNRYNVGVEGSSGRGPTKFSAGVQITPKTRLDVGVGVRSNKGNAEAKLSHQTRVGKFSAYGRKDYAGIGWTKRF